MFLNIVTPVTRHGNLFDIRRSINIPRGLFRWICVFDGRSIPLHLPLDCEAYMCKDINSTVGNAQRNYALNLIKEGHVYFNDDDTTVHKELWKTIKDFGAHDFIHFSQANKDGSLRLEGRKVKLGKIDTHCFVIDRKCIGDTRWIIDKYNADGVFAEECYKKAKTPLFIPKILSVYNSLQ